MQRDFVSMQSEELNREMPVIVYGEAGYPIVVFPTQDSPCTNWEEFGMFDVLAPFIDSKQVQLFCVDSVDKETWSDAAGDKAARADRQEAFYRYVCNELIPFVHETNGSELRPLATGCSMGATHAVIFALRRPDLFEGCIAMSGVYDAHYFFGDWGNETLYLNSPTDFLPGMSVDHALIPTYNKRQLVLCMGQGAWENEGIRTQRILQAEFKRLGVNAWCDFWGFDVSHDWPWWKKQVVYFLPIVLENIKVAARQKQIDLEEKPEEEPAPKKAAAKKPAAKKTAAAKKAPAKKTAATKKTATTKATATKKTTAAKTAAAKKTTAAKKPAAKKTATKASAKKE